MYRSHSCGELRASHINTEVTLAGWVQKSRDKGFMVWVDLRDRYGITQLIFDEARTPTAMMDKAKSLGREFVIQVTGTVIERESKNAKMTTGNVEVLVSKLEILNKALTPPFTIEDTTDGGEDIRMKYRYLDIRRNPVKDSLIFRHKVSMEVRKYLSDQEFIEVETPYLIKSTPEGARDFVVPSRMNEGQFYALPQSPQTFKQLLMVGGMDKYFQIVKCFRDEDLRADRQPEFTQIDCEMAFVEQEDILQQFEGLLTHLLKEIKEVDVATFPRMTYADAMHKYGSDKPDLRIPLELVEVKDLLKDIEFKVFAGPANDPACRVTALKVPGGAEISRKKIDEYTKFVSIYGAKGLAWIKVNAIETGIEGLQSPIIKFLGDEVTMNIMQRLDAKNGDIVFFGADKANVVSEALGALRCKVGEDLNLYTCDWAPMWVVDFPMFERTDSGALTPLHHPFTAPSCSAEELKADPANALSRAYDMVLNGCELGGGSIRIHDQAMQEVVFDVLGIGEEEQREKFGFLLDALKHGAPPHGGLAFGLDRLIMLMVGADSIRDVIAFPKTQSAACLLTDAPGTVEAAQLRDLSIRLRVKEEKSSS